jgi:tetratricopeptide (TPR) repeat protein
LKALGDLAWQANHIGDVQDYYYESPSVCKDCHDLRGEAITLKALGDLALKEGDKANAQKYFSLCLGLFRQMKDLRGQGVTLHSLGILILEQGDRTSARTHLDQSLDLLRKVQDRSSEAAVLNALAVCVEARGDLAQAQKYYRESLQIATEIKAAHDIAVFQETLGDFLLKHNGQKDRQEGNLLLVKAAESYRLIGRIDDAEQVEERRVGRYRIPDRGRIMSTLIYDLDQGPNGQGFAVPHERRSALRPA